MDSLVGSKIQQLLSMKGLCRLEVENGVTQKILSHDEEKTPGIRLKFLEAKKRDLEGGSWEEYSILYEVTKYSDSPEYLGHVFKSLGKIIKTYESLFHCLKYIIICT